MNPGLIPAIRGCLACLLPLILMACQEKPVPPVAAVPEVAVMTIEGRTIPVEWEFVGQTESSRLVEIRTRVEGFLDKRLYEEGKPVRKDQILFQLDPRPFNAVLLSQKGALAQQEARLKNAQRNLARLKDLIAQNAVSQKDVDDAESEVAEADAAVLSARAQVTSAELNLGYATIRSPLDGLSGRARKTEGSLVSPGSDGLLTTVAQTNPMWVNFSASESRVLAIRDAIAKNRLLRPEHGEYVVELRLSDGSAYPHPGKLNFADALISPDTGTFGLRAEFANPEVMLVPGQFVRVTMKGATRPNAILVPQRIVQQGQQGKFVYVAAPGDKVEMRLIEVGDWYGSDWIVEQGLGPGERVILDALGRLMPDMPIKPVPQALGGPAGAPEGGKP